MEIVYPTYSEMAEKVQMQVSPPNAQKLRGTDKKRPG